MAHTPTPRAAHSIGDLAAATGVPVETIRMWERRYGRPASSRLASGHRRYGKRELTWLRLAAAATARGMKPSDAAQLTSRQLAARSDAAESPLPRPVRTALAAAAKLDSARLADVLRRAAARRTPRAFVEEIAGPLLTAVGRAWERGTLGVGNEHMVAESVEARLHVIALSGAPDAKGARLVLTSLTGDRHGLGPTMVGVVAAHCGARCLVLGADTPLADVVSAAVDGTAHAVVVSVSLAHRGPIADRDLNSLRRHLPASIRLLVGGAGASGPTRRRDGIEHLPDFAAFERVVGELAPR